MGTGYISMGENSAKKGFPVLSMRSKVQGGVTMAVTFCAIALFAVLYHRYLVPVYILCMILAVIELIGIELLLFWKPRRFDISMTAIGLGLVAFMVVVSILVPWDIDSSDPGSYEENMHYIRDRGYSVLSFPDQVPEDVEGYDFEFRPDRFSDKGHIYIEYCCTQSAMAGYQMKVEKMAVISPLSIKESQSMNLNMESQAKMAEAFGLEELDVSSFDFKVVLPDDIDEHPNTQVYVMSCELDDEHPNTEAILIDVENGWVCFSRLF